MGIAHNMVNSYKNIHGILKQAKHLKVNGSTFLSVGEITVHSYLSMYIQ